MTATIHATCSLRTVVLSVMSLLLLMVFVSTARADEPEKTDSQTDKPKVLKMYRCQDASGKVIFSDVPCSPRAMTRELRVKPAEPRLGERCILRREREACMQLQRLHEENPTAAEAEVRAGEEAARRAYEERQMRESRVYDCIRRNERFEFQTRRQLDSYRREEIRAQCQTNPD